MISKRMNAKRGVSPVIATVLLVAMVVVIAFVLFLWIKGLTKEAVTKFGGTNIELVCNNVEFKADYGGGVLSITNIGNVPVFSFNLKIDKIGSHVTKNIKDISKKWPETGLGQGGLYVSEDLSSELNSATDIIIMPVLAGSSKGGKRTHDCTESHGREISL